MKLMLAAVLLFGLTAPAVPTRVTIDAVYPKGEIFAVRVATTQTTKVTGHAPQAFASGSETDTGTVQLWLAGMDGKYRITANKGTIKVTTTRANGKLTRQTVPASGTIEFDALGYPKTNPSDPAGLIPIFPGHPVAAGSTWTARAPISESLGSGTGVYTYHLDAIRLAPNRHILAAVSFRLQGLSMQPATSLPGWRATLTGAGALLWDCTAHEKSSSHYQLLYRATRGRNRIEQVVTYPSTMRRVH